MFHQIESWYWLNWILLSLHFNFFQITMQPTFPICDNYENQLKILDIYSSVAKEFIAKMYGTTSEIYVPKVERLKEHYLAQIRHRNQPELMKNIEKWSKKACDAIKQQKINFVSLADYNIVKFKPFEFNASKSDIDANQKMQSLNCDKAILYYLNTIAALNHKIRDALKSNGIPNFNLIPPELKFDMSNMESRLQQAVESLNENKSGSQIKNKTEAILKQIATEKFEMFHEKWQNSRALMLKEAEQCLMMKGDVRIKVDELNRSVQMLGNMSDEPVEIQLYNLKIAVLSEISFEKTSTFTLQIGQQILKKKTDYSISRINDIVKELNQALQLVEYQISNFRIQ